MVVDQSCSLSPKDKLLVLQLHAEQPVQEAGRSVLILVITDMYPSLQHADATGGLKGFLKRDDATVPQEVFDYGRKAQASAAM